MTPELRDAAAWRKIFLGLDPEQIARHILADLFGYPRGNSLKNAARQHDVDQLANAIRAVAANAATMQAQLYGTPDVEDIAIRHANEELTAGAERLAEYLSAETCLAIMLGEPLKPANEESDNAAT